MSGVSRITQVLEIVREDPRKSLRSVMRYLRYYPILNEIVYRMLGVMRKEAIVEVLGSRMIVSFSDRGISRQLFFDKIREPESTRLFVNQLEDAMTVLDIGSSIGYFPLVEATIVKRGKIYAMEPDTRNVELLKRTLALNSLTDRVPVFNMAIGDRTGEARFIASDCLNCGRVAKDCEGGGGGGAIAVPMMSIDDFIAKEGCDVDFIRCDVEGYEYFIIKGAEKTLRNSRKLKIFMEVHPTSIRMFGGDVLEMFEMLSDFKVEYLVTVSKPPLIDFINPFRGHSLRCEEVTRFDSRVSELITDGGLRRLLQGSFYRIFLEKGR